ncbi:MAG TPA: hypothetical protein VJ765_10545 [Chitinophagaceae bacterium]|nr:hypothetical protein [Chitinophagaceae bacterium]
METYVAFKEQPSVKHLQKVSGEMNLIMLVYNIKRTLSILGFTRMMEALQSWKLDYNQIVCQLFSDRMRLYWMPLVDFFYNQQWVFMLLKSA